MLNNFYGTPELSNSYPSQFKHIKDGMVFSHIWHLDEETSAVLGTGKYEDKYFLAIRFQEKTNKEGYK